ncbi:hypothetical protein HJG60_011573 [Phyllostomus discolor]|uniref:Uncharacterized protein n=1 Tax=Phyllostomus discolor TaxID=89673 RepID=A0A833ZW18_9CHIR|nr:hypothetical protein HJG60_011573 [Phyllostomus discolor]
MRKDSVRKQWVRGILGTKRKDSVMQTEPGGQNHVLSQPSSWGSQVRQLSLPNGPMLPLCPSWTPHRHGACPKLVYVCVHRHTYTPRHTHTHVCTLTHACSHTRLTFLSSPGSETMTLLLTGSKQPP